MKNIKFTANYQFAEPYIPPRCRKPRYKDTKAVTTIRIPCVTPDEAPVAFRHPVVSPSYIREYRLFKNRLYARVPFCRKQSNTEGWWPLEELERIIMTSDARSNLRSYPVGDFHSVEECEKFLKAKYSGLLLIEVGGKLQIWEKIGEPRYEVITFGLGHNHASTDYFITNHYNSNVSKDCYFTALQHDEVVRCALETAAARGDTNSFEDIRNGPVIEVLIPSAVKCKPQKEAGDGNSFLNSLKEMTMLAGSVGEAAALVMVAAGTTLKDKTKEENE